MKPEQKERAQVALGMWLSSNSDSLREHQSGELMAALLKELVAAPNEMSAGPERIQSMAAIKDKVFQASLDFIQSLTGMSPPPIEVAPPEVFAPFRDFTEKVMRIVATLDSNPTGDSKCGRQPK